MKISARNVLEGIIKDVIHGSVNSEVIIELVSGGEIVSVITKESAEGLKLQAGKKVFAVIKASNVMVMTE